MQEAATRYTTELETRRREHLFRQLRTSCPSSPGMVRLEGCDLINFASNDYMGLSQHPQVKGRAAEYVALYGAGATASRLMSGNLDAYDLIESKLARLKGTEAALVFSTGYQANSTVLPALTGDGALIACDRLCHNSLLQGALSGRARWFRFRHNDVDDLRARLLSRTNRGQSSRWVVTESIFGMDGDLAPMKELEQVAAEFDASIFVDEAHASGVAGPLGMGLATASSRCVSMGTFGKALGSFGAYIACSAELRDYLVNFASGLIYSTALPPAVLGAIDAALDLVPQMTEDRVALQDKSRWLRAQLRQCGFDTGTSESHIIPVITGADRTALSLAAYLEQCGIFAPAIRPPTVAPNSARVRFSLTIDHTYAQLDHLISSLKDWHERDD